MNFAANLQVVAMDECIHDPLLVCATRIFRELITATWFFAPHHLGVRLNEELCRAQERKDCPLYVKEALEEEYKEYHTLKGNGVGTNIYNVLMNLPTEPPEKKGE